MEGKIKKHKDGFASYSCGILIATSKTINQVKLDTGSYFKKKFNGHAIEIKFEGNSFTVSEIQYDYSDKKFMWTSAIDWFTDRRNEE